MSVFSDMMSDEIIVSNSEWVQLEINCSFQEPKVIIDWIDYVIDEWDLLVRKIWPREIEYMITGVKYHTDPTWKRWHHDMSHITLLVEKKKLYDAKVKEPKSIHINAIHNHGWNVAVENTWTQQVWTTIDVEKLIQLIQASDHDNKNLIADAIKQYQSTKDATTLWKAISYSADGVTILWMIQSLFTWW